MIKLIRDIRVFVTFLLRSNPPHIIYPMTIFTADNPYRFYRMLLFKGIQLSFKREHHPELEPCAPLFLILLNSRSYPRVFLLDSRSQDTGRMTIHNQIDAEHTDHYRCDLHEEKSFDDRVMSSSKHAFPLFHQCPTIF